MKSVYVLLVVATVAKAQIPNLGFCPDYLPMADFDIERFLGKWYEAERYFQFSEIVARCVVTDYAKAPSGRIYVSNEITNRITGVKRVIGGNLELAGRAREGKLHVKYATTPISTDSVLTVLDTDYDEFAVIWSCSGFGPIHAQSAWVMTRDRLPNGNVLQRAYGVLDKYRISRTFFVKTDQEGCALAASDINAANGITSISTMAESTGNEQKSLVHGTEKLNSLPEQEEKVQAEQPIAQEAIDVKKTEDVLKEQKQGNEAGLSQVPVENSKPVEDIKEQREVEQTIVQDQLVGDSVDSSKNQKPIGSDKQKGEQIVQDQVAEEAQSPIETSKTVSDQQKTEPISNQKVLTVAEVVIQHASQDQQKQSSKSDEPQVVRDNSVQDQVVEEAQVVQVAHSPDELIPVQKPVVSDNKN